MIDNTPARPGTASDERAALQRFRSGIDLPGLRCYPGTNHAVRLAGKLRTCQPDASSPPVPA